MPTDYAILSDGNGSPVENVVPFSAIVNALNEFNFSSERIESVWRLLGAILELGNIEFYDADEPTGIAAKISEKSQHHLHVAAALLSVSVDDLLLVLLTREMKTGREIFTIPLKFRESLNARNAFLKTLYSNLFTEIVSSVNQKLSNCVATNTNTISVLDIFGFECFEQNDFEQVLVFSLTIPLLILIVFN